MSKTTAIRLPDNTYTRLRNPALQTGRTATDYIQEAVETHLDDLEDAYLAEKALEDIRSGLVKPISLDEMSQRLGLDNRV
uniref:Relaxosome protein TraY n=1 Tax=Candidatus Kentrum eta TaxID=2126337 RepID=A0A450ULB5_9GAMM|nr:MAG: RHH-type transcriptional regulator, rel operon repressor / antitoxin RelB [Candidatus Kentron sp. H]VFJ93342.1 MAG: RHH-type transcriptional regulator, rel operon repressor / antitoxin RelB [Candidatus Kentron sp. H]VFK00141.1 MAG: RHH-type transcriptional regulator, rel operon repressor / antitoxin RelB [Candidatus Kentron sp. H]